MLLGFQFSEEIFEHAWASFSIRIGLFFVPGHEELKTTKLYIS